MFGNNKIEQQGRIWGETVMGASGTYPEQLGRDWRGGGRRGTEVKVPVFHFQ